MPAKDRFATGRHAPPYRSSPTQAETEGTHSVNRKAVIVFAAALRTPASTLTERAESRAHRTSR